MGVLITGLRIALWQSICGVSSMCFQEISQNRGVDANLMSLIAVLLEGTFQQQ